MDKDMIISQLERRIEEQGSGLMAGRRKKKGGKLSELEKYAGYNNPYEDDGSMNFQKIRLSVMRKMAFDLFGSEYTDHPFEAMASLKKSDIDKEMSRLKRLKDIELEESLRNFHEKREVYDELEPSRKLKKKADAIGIEKSTKKSIYEKLNPYVKTLSELDAVKNSALLHKPLLLGDGRKKSAWQVFAGKKMKEGYSMKEAAQLWKKSK